MLNGLYSAASGMLAQQARMDALSNDIANVNTAGYKQVRLGFRDLVYNQEAGMPVGAGASIVDAGRQFGQGSLDQTGNPLDLAIQGPGFFQVRRADGQLALTRAGSFSIDARGALVTASGERLVPQITVPRGTSADDVSVAADGTVRAGQQRIGRIVLVTVPAPGALIAVGSNDFLPSAASGAPVAARGGTLQQGYVEASNVDLGSAMVDVIDAQRSFELDGKVIQTQDQLMQIANDIRR
jgi:flagellar basal-body rod protein FlgG